MTPQEALYLHTHNGATIQQEMEVESIIIDALNKQIHKKPLGKTDPTFGDVCIVCPNCGNRGLANPFAKSRVYDYCPKCGQKIDWVMKNESI